MKTLAFFTLLTLAFVSNSCSRGPQPIEYGHDDCIQCAMKIMDARYGTEIVTTTGKVYKFDSVECLIDFINENKKDSADFRHILITPFNAPNTLEDALNGHYLHSASLPSPMGMHLTAFRDEATALSFKEQFGGKTYCWKGLNENFSMIRMKGTPSDGSEADIDP
jgi:copper chaperone NosL